MINRSDKTMSLPISTLIENLILPDSVDSGRIFHGRGHFFPGLEHINVDLFFPVILITSYRSITDEDQQALCDALLKQVKGVKALALQQRELPQTPMTWLWGEAVSRLEIQEAGLSYGISLGSRQNVGFFPDMSNGRLWMRQAAKGKKVLNLFSYTCAFSVAAMAGGAASVVNLDMSSASLSQGRDNHKLNQQPLENVKFFAHDLFKSWGKLRRFGSYDLIVVDPPSLQKGSFDAKRDYVKVVRRMASLLSEQGEVLFCLNAPELSFEFLMDLVANAAPELEFVQKLATAEVFNEIDPNKGLKCVIYKLA